MKGQPRRSWEAAREKVERERECRYGANQFFHRDVPLTVCGGPVEAAHITSREHDKKPIIFEAIPSSRSGLWVAPSRIVPLCRAHHAAYDAHELDLLGYLTAAEEAQAVLDAGSLESARRRLCPSAYRKEAA